ncbi:riboflavin biosynthesis protein RibF [Porphyromonas sp.]|uniref:riboflavin biosynthesis protein RibF n=1 Tax=Porphyromonas sp. TaxID=1924944 RepID=UPI0026DA756A|nr:riboflavin biosynthesis protein RibF [Porphyromonas sp.]MDO4695689.1 riboflavin biosynthesis protein RibF [Porphyromonas sp.]MDO4771710.1 riboflavin biosynthesis protein RibF [Porphyromonas sp.]
MNIYSQIEDFIAHYSGTPTAATIGFFDGVHKGHQKLLSELSRKAKEIGGESLVITFDEHPIKVLRPEIEPPVVLSSLSSKISLIAEAGIDNLIVIHFTKDVAAIEPHAFIEPLITHGGLVDLVMGYDNRFGRRSDMSLDDYDAYITSWGIGLTRITPLFVEDGIVSSSAIRELVTSCQFDTVDLLLGRPYGFRGMVKHGRKIGRTIDYPTANIQPLEPNIFLPAVGIYIAEVRVGCEIYQAMAYYGGCPTIDDSHKLGLEAYILDYSGDLYGQEVEIGFRRFLRPDQKFDSIEDLAAQLKKDELYTRSFFKTHPMSMLSFRDIMLKDFRR